MNCEKWTNRELNLFYYLTGALYFLLTVVCPGGLIIWKYKMFQNGGGYEVNGAVLIIVLAIVFIGLRRFKTWLNRYDAETIKEMRFKFTMQGIFALAYPIVAIIVLLALKDNFKVAFSVCKLSVGFFIASIILDYGFIKYFETERHLRKEAQHRMNVTKREVYAK